MASRKQSLNPHARPGSPRQADPHPGSLRSTAADVSTHETVSLPAPDHEPKPAGPAQRPSTVLGDYQLLSRLGQGGMGAVYKATQLALDREVALKVLNRDLAARPGFIDRFRREARALAKLNHPNIIQCYDIGEARGYHYIAMEYMDGGSVEAWLRKLRKFSLPDAMHLALACAYALHYAHDEGLVHRDIKPDNVLLRRNGLVKVADLGLVKDLDEDLGVTRPGAGAGTPLYIAPEQARSLRLADQRSDIYSLGCMLYVFLTGCYPFRGNNIIDIVLAKQRGKYTPMRDLEPSLPRRIEQIVGRMLRPKPDDRYQDCADIIADLEAFGKSSRQLGFLANAVAIPRAAGKPTQVKLPPFQHTITQMPVLPRATPGAGAKATADAGELWYWLVKTKDGKVAAKEVTAAQLRTLIETGIVTASARVSKSPKTGFRILGSWREFQPQFRARRDSKARPPKPRKTKPALTKPARSKPATAKDPVPTNEGGSWVVVLLLLLMFFGSVGGSWYLLTWILSQP